MRQLVALLGLVWAIGNLYAAYLFVAGGLAAKTAAKGLGQQALLVLGGLIIGLFAASLVWQCVCLGRSRESEASAS